MRNIFRHLFTRAVLLAGALGTGTGPAIAQEPIPADEAALRIEALLKDIDDAKQALVARVDYTASTGILIDEMRNAGVSPSAIDKYAKDWAQGYIYLPWSWVQPFYDAHAQALTESLGRVRGVDAVPASDVEYLEQGMEAWRGAEGEIQLLFGELIRVLVQRGMYLGRSLELSDRKFKEAECCSPEWEEFNARIREEDLHAAEFSVEARYAATVVQEYGSQRYFSAIDPATEVALVDDADASPDGEDMEEECEEVTLGDDQEEIADVLDAIQAAYDASEASSFEFLRESEESFRERTSPFAEPTE
jgi:hypothetical protein